MLTALRRPPCARPAGAAAQVAKAAECLRPWLPEAPAPDHPAPAPALPHPGHGAGRFSCSDPNIQQLPADAELRGLVRADAGRLLVCADYSQIELRIAALLSEDPTLLAAYSAGEDLHAQTAKALCGDATQRQLGKCANFGLLFGSGAAGLQTFAKNKYGVDMTLAEAIGHRNRFFRTYAGLRQWQEESIRPHDDRRRFTPEAGWCGCSSPTA